MVFLHRGTDFCSHYVRSLKAIAKPRSKSLGILFVDVVTAFASALRDLVFSKPVSESSVASFSQLGCKPDIYQDLLDSTHDSHACDRAHVPPDLQCLVNSLAGGIFLP